MSIRLPLQGTIRAHLPHALVHFAKAPDWLSNIPLRSAASEGLGIHWVGAWVAEVSEDATTRCFQVLLMVRACYLRVWQSLTALSQVPLCNVDA